MKTFFHGICLLRNSFFVVMPLSTATRVLLFGLLLSLLQPGSHAQAQPHKPSPPNVTFFSPNPPGNPFWDKVADFMRAVAEDLDVELKVFYSKGNTYSYKKDGLELVESLPSGHYLITGYFTGSTTKYIQRANERGIKVFVINAGVPEEDQSTVGKPREKLENWIGHIAASDFQAGYELANALINKAASLNKYPEQNIQVVALGGGTDSVVPLQRRLGLEKRVEEQNNVRLTSLVDTMWTQKEAGITAAKLLSEYSDADVVWTPGDSMSLGTIEAIKATGKRPGHDILTGGIDWSDSGIAAVASGEMTASVGGHLFEGGWALLLIHDYHYGTDFVADPGVSSTTEMRAITADNVRTYIKWLHEPDWSRIDFKQFSKKHNPALQKYDFSLESLLNAFDKNG